MFSYRPPPSSSSFLLFPRLQPEKTIIVLPMSTVHMEDACENSDEHMASLEGGQYLDQLSDCLLTLQSRNVIVGEQIATKVKVWNLKKDLRNLRQLCFISRLFHDLTEHRACCNVKLVLRLIKNHAMKTYGKVDV